MTVLKSLSNLVFYFRLVCKFIFGFLCPQHLTMYSMSSLKAATQVSHCVPLFSPSKTVLIYLRCSQKLLKLCPHHIACTSVMLSGFSCVWPCVTLWITVCWLHCPWDFPGKNTGVGGHFLLQEIFPTEGLDPGLLCLPVLAGRFFTNEPFINYPNIALKFSWNPCHSPKCYIIWDKETEDNILLYPSSRRVITSDIYSL